jgi:hypothetical protein
MDTDSGDTRDDPETIIDEDAAQIDPRDPDAPEQIAELMEEADQMGLERSLPDPLDPPEPA